MAPDLSLAEHVCLALVVEESRHGWAIVRELDRGGDLGAIWSLSRALTYRAVDQLVDKGFVRRGEVEAGHGPNRVTLTATSQGRRSSDRWLATPVRHVRDLRTEFLLKATLLGRRGGDVAALVVAQEAELAPVLAALAGDDDGSPVGLWRRESALAAQRFFTALRTELAGSV